MIRVDLAAGNDVGEMTAHRHHTEVLDGELDLQVEFAVKHFGMMTVRGHFADVVASGEIDPDHPESSSLDVTINTASIKTNNEQRDSDLRSSNFLEIDKFPTITFKSKRIEASGKDTYTMSGDLTI